jgi:type II secretory pathway pseudopilin PulG
MIKNKINLNKKNGYTLLETLFYISIFAILSIAVIDSLITMSRSFKETTTQAELMQGGDIMEKISREIRQAQSITSITGSSDLKITNTDGSQSEFLLSNENVAFSENNVFVDNLNDSNIEVTSLIFTQVNTIQGEAVKISLSVESKDDLSNRTENFYDTVVLRGQY